MMDMRTIKRLLYITHAWILIALFPILINHMTEENSLYTFIVLILTCYLGGGMMLYVIAESQEVNL